MGTLVGIAVCVGNKRAVATAPAESEPTGIMTFADPAVQALCAKTWGDGTNITYEQAREVTEIPKNWAKGNTTITSFNEIKYFKNCRTIGGFAFNGCKSMALTSLELPQCTSIGEAAFERCSLMALTSLELPQCKSIGNSAFNGCSSMALTSLELPQCTTIGNSAFNGCSSMALTSLELPQCTAIGGSAFYNCSSMALTSLELPQCTSIGGSAFERCSSMALTSLELPQCTSIWESAFKDCKSMALTKLDLPQCTTIGSECFAYTKGIGKLNWGELAKNVINDGFKHIGGIGIPIVNIPNIAAWFESTFGYVNASPAIYSHNLCQNDVPMPDVVIPEGCTKVGQKTLCYLHLNSLSIPETVTSIGDYNQYALHLPVFDIPSSVTKIGQYVIGGNYDSNVKNVPTVICRAVTPPTLGTVKANGGAHQAIYVPDESVEAYKTATNWSAFADIILPLSQYNG